MKARIFGVACLLLTSVGCEDDDDNGSSRNRADSFTFENTVTAEEFDAKLDELQELRQSGSALTSSTPASGFAHALLGATTVTEGCSDISAIFGMDGSMPEQSEFRLQEGDSCGNAVDNIKAFYSQALDSMNAQVTQLKDIKPGTETCGMRATAVDVDENKAAVGYKFTPYEDVDGLLYEHTTVGAATDTTVSLGTSMEILMFGNQSDEDMAGLNNYKMSGRLESVGDLENRGLDFTTEFKMSMSMENGTGGLMTMTNSLAGTASITGLDDKLNLTETSRYEFMLDSGDGSDRDRTALDMSFNMEELDDGTLKLVGHIEGHEAHGPMDFEVYMENTGYGCQISMDYDPTTTGENPPPPEPINGGGDGTDEEYVVQESDLQGTWVTPWNTSFHNGYYAKQQLEFTDSSFKLSQNVMADTSDEESEHYFFIYEGNYVLTETNDYNPTDNDESFIGIDMMNISLHIRPETDAAVEQFNTDEFCGATNWVKGEAKEVLPANCDLEEESRPYRTIGFEPNGVILRLSETSYFHGSSADNRASFYSDYDGVRFLKN